LPYQSLFYLAVAPEFFVDIASGISNAKLIEKGNSIGRIVFEKPFGVSFESAKKINQKLSDYFEENQIFRIDHYLAKETLQNILTFRFANAMFEPIWNGDSIERVDVELLESFDIKKRGSFYDGIGALRDVGQNHILQMLAIIAMEDPGHIDPASIRAARANVLESTELAGSIETSVVRGQYEGYQSMEGVAPDSKTETFFNAKLKITTPRWKGTEFYIRSGKALNETCSRITITFKERVSCMCPENDTRSHKNTVTFMIQPNEGISVQFWAKRPGFAYTLEEKDLSFMYPVSDQRLPDAYERVLYDALRGDQTLFISTEEVIVQWNLIMPILEQWSVLPMHTYTKGVRPDEIGGTI